MKMNFYVQVFINTYEQRCNEETAPWPSSARSAILKLFVYAMLNIFLHVCSYMNINIWNSYIWTADKDGIMYRSSQRRCFNLNGWKEKTWKNSSLNFSGSFFSTA